MTGANMTSGIKKRENGNGTETPARKPERLREKLLKELGQFSLICGVAAAGAALTACDDDAWYDEVRLEDCNGDNRIDTRDRDCQGASDESSESSGSSSWDNHYNVIEYPNWADVSTW